MMMGVMTCAGGCFPYKFTTRPAVAGRVVNAQTSAPIAGAQVEARSDAANTRHSSSSATSSDGRFQFERQTKWGLFIIPMDVWVPGAQLRVDHPDFMPAEKDFPGALNRGPATINAGDLKLQPRTR
jgi:hypothetical protein